MSEHKTAEHVVDRLRRLSENPGLTVHAARDIAQGAMWIEKLQREVAKLEKTIERYAEAMEEDGNV